ncbi:MAG: thiamine pyrophosphate-dependent dehydrogenase E1 component subunit alpha [Clostridia bacterium]
MKLARERYLKVYKDMLLIRRFEEEVGKYAQNGTIPGFVHLGIGQEASQAGIVDCLKATDYKFPDHRGHGVCILSGTEPKYVMAELFGRADGINNGRGGSMHVNDLTVRNMGCNGIQGCLPVYALGTAFAARYKKQNDVSAVFMGDGTLGEGTCHESMNMAATWKLPIVYCLLNNQYAISTHYTTSHPQKELKTWGEGYEVPSFRIDGNDIEEVIEYTEAAVERARKGEGPTLLELMTYRWQGHFSGDPAAYRPEGELEEWKKKDPLIIASKRLVEREHVTAEELAEIAQEVEKIVADAVEFALNSPMPTKESALLHVYADFEVEGR